MGVSARRGARNSSNRVAGYFQDRLPQRRGSFGLRSAAHFTPSQLDHLDRFAQLALVAAREAVRDSGIAWTPALRERTAIVTGSSVGGQTTEDVGFDDVYRRGKNRVHPLDNSPHHGQRGRQPNLDGAWPYRPGLLAISTACSSSNHAFAQALALLRSGAADAAIAGGSEAPFKASAC